MLKKLINPLGKQDAQWRVFFTALVILLLTMDVISNFIPARMGDINNVYGQMLVVAAMVLYLYHQRFSGPVEIKLMLAYCVWILLSRILNKDMYLFIDKALVYQGMLMFCTFAAARMMKREQRRTMMNVLTVIVGSFAFFLSAASIFVVLTDTYIHIPPEDIWITVTKYGIGGGKFFYAMNLLSAHRNGTALWIFIGFALMLYQFFACRRKAWRIPIVIAAVTEFVTVALCHSRTVSVSLGFCAGLLAVLLAIEHFREKKKVIVVPAAAVLCLAVTVLTYKAGDLSLSVVSKLSAKTIPAFAQVYENSEHKLNPDNFGITIKEISSPVRQKPIAQAMTLSSHHEAKPVQLAAENAGIDMSEQRDFMNDLSTFTLRTKIWKAVIPAIKDRPATALIGTLTKTMIEPIRQYAGVEANHMHNYLLQTLMLMGIPGLLLVAAVSVLIVVKALRIFFNDDGRVPFEAKLLVLPVAAIMLDFMLEAGLFTTADLRCLSFYIFAGLLLGWHEDCFE